MVKFSNWIHFTYLPSQLRVLPGVIVASTFLMCDRPDFCIALIRFSRVTWASQNSHWLYSSTSVQSLGSRFLATPKRCLKFVPSSLISFSVTVNFLPFLHLHPLTSINSFEPRTFMMAPSDLPINPPAWAGSRNKKSSDIPTDMAFSASVTLPAMSKASRQFRLIPVSIWTRHLVLNSPDRRRRSIFEASIPADRIALVTDYCLLFSWMKLCCLVVEDASVVL